MDAILKLTVSTGSPEVGLNHLFSVTTQHIKGVLKRLLAWPRVERNMNK